MLIKTTLAIILFLALSISSIPRSAHSARWSPQSSAISLTGLQEQVRVVRDNSGVPHIFASNDADAYFMLGFIHAEDRFFQMDVNRRQASGTLAELLGPGPSNQTIASDVQFRTIGLRRAAERSRAAYSPEAIAVLQSYADGVNSFLDTKPLPPEYSLLELTRTGVPNWTVTDSIAILKLFAFGLSFDGTELTNTTTLLAYRTAGAVAGFDGSKLFFDDMFRIAPFDPTISIPNPQSAGAVASAKLNTESVKREARPEEFLTPQTMASLNELFKDAAHNPLFNDPTSDRGSNWFVVSGDKTDTGFPMLANDPHLTLGSPPIFYEAHLVVEGSDQEALNVYGVTFPGMPGFPQGLNDHIAWGSTVNPLDDTDFYQERIILDSAGRPVATLFQGAPEPLVLIPQIFRANIIGDNRQDVTIVITAGVPPGSLVVPRRNNGALITSPSGAPPNGPTAISFQYTGSSATRELESFLIFSRARNIDDFKRGLQFFDVGSQNWSYMDRDGNIAYFTSAELPLREDLQAGTVDGGIPPFFVRDGTGTRKHEWIVKNNPPPDQALRYEILPFDEMPQVVNPARGFIVNANNDPIGTTLDNNPLNQPRRGGQGILYLAASYVMGNRAARIDGLIRDKIDEGEISFEDMKRIQSDVQMLDAKVLTPYIIQAFSAARQQDAPPPLAAFANDPAITEAFGRLARWNYTTPTGIEEGFDAKDTDDNDLRKPKGKEIEHSVAATIYSVWRGQIIKNTIDATLTRVGLGSFTPGGERTMIALRNLLDNFATNRGRGASGLNFFDIRNVTLTPEVERDIIILQSLKDALNLLASPVFAPAFAGSTNQKDYRWGKLHRIVFRHPLNRAPFNIPPGAGFTDLSPQLPGIATDGGFDTVDAAGHISRASTPNDFMFSGGPARRFVGEARTNKIKAVQVIPGGASGVPGTQFFGNLLGTWLVNEYHDVLTSTSKVNRKNASEVIFDPVR